MRTHEVNVFHSINFLLKFSQPIRDWKGAMPIARESLMVRESGVVWTSITRRLQGDQSMLTSQVTWCGGFLGFKTWGKA